MGHDHLIEELASGEGPVEGQLRGLGRCDDAPVVVFERRFGLVKSGRERTDLSIGVFTASVRAIAALL